MGFNVLVGGKMGSGGYRIAAPLDVFVEPSMAAELCAAITLIFRDYGRRESRAKARLTFLIDEWGMEGLREAVEDRLGRPLFRAGQDERLPEHTDHIGVARQKHPEMNSVGLLIPAGRIEASQVEELARLAECYGGGQIRLTTGQNAILTDVPDAALDALLAEPLLQAISPEPSHIDRKSVV